MPVQNGRDQKGVFYRWGNSGKKYYYNSLQEKLISYRKAVQQGKAIHASRR